MVKTKYFQNYSIDMLLPSFNGSGVILLDKLSVENTRNLSSFTEYGTGNVGLDIKDLELPTLNGYVQGPLPLNNVLKETDDGIYISCDDIIYLNNESIYDVYGLAIVKGSNVLLSISFDSKFSVRNADISFSLSKSITDKNILLKSD